MADEAATVARPRALAPFLGHVGIGVAIALGVGALGAADGGYFPPSWGWTALVSLWLVGAWLLLGRAALNGGRLSALYAGGFAALAGWTWLSLAWTDNTVQTVLEGFRTLAYAGVAAALVLVVRSHAAPALLRGVAAAIAVVSLYGLGTRLFPDRLGAYDPISGYRLSEPLGYWNGFGIFAAMGAILLLAFLARDRSTVVRALAAGAFAPLLPAIYFTFSRGALIALVIGILAAIALDTRRLQLILALVVAGIPGLAGVWVGSQSEALTRQDAPLSSAVDQGAEVAIILALLALLAAGANVALGLAERRVEPGRQVRLAFAAVIVLLAAAVVLGAFVRAGGPVNLVENAYDAFDTPPPQGADLGERLFTFSGSYRLETWGEAVDQFSDNPILGGGAGTYEQYWNASRPIEHKVRDAHTLYGETLGELGPLGLALLAFALVMPLVAAARSRVHPLAAGAFGAYVAYLVHAGIDWDWELPAVTVVALACGAALLVLRPRNDLPVAAGSRQRIAGAVAALVLSAVAFVGLVGSSALSASEEGAAARTPDWEKVEDDAQKARRWMPWSSEPWQRLGEAQIEQERLPEARRSFRKAIEKEPDDWLLWFRLAEASSGADRREALAEARRLNPLSPEIAAFPQAGG